MNKKLAGVLFAVLAAGVFLIPAFVLPSPTPDWPAFYAAAKLAPLGSAKLYSFAEMKRITSSFENPAFVWAFVRPPFYAFVLFPLGLLRPWAAFVAWQLANLVALACFQALMWPSRIGLLAMVACAPLWVSFRQGQDMPLLLLIVGVTIFLLEHNRAGLAGAVMSLCTIKFHLLLLVPMFLLAHRGWRMAAGLCLGVAALLIGCFTIYGGDWPAQYSRSMIENQRHLHTASLWTLAPAPWGPITVVTVLALGCYFACRKISSPAIAFAVSLVFSFLAAPRAYIYDAAITLPALLLILRSSVDSRLPVAQMCTQPTLKNA